MFQLLHRPGNERLTLNREMQLFLAGYVLIEICEIFSIGGFPLNSTTRRAFSAVHIAAIVATLWVLMLNGFVGYQLLDDGTAVSVGLLLVSAVILFIGTGYIALDTAFSWTGYWDSTLTGNNRAYALYTLYQLAPIVFLVIFFLLEAFLVLRILGERKPMSKWPMSAFTHTSFALKLTNYFSVSHRRSSIVCYWTDLPIRGQRSYLQWYGRKDQWRSI
jgi:hypothetical protein